MPAPFGTWRGFIGCTFCLRQHEPVTTIDEGCVCDLCRITTLAPTGPLDRDGLTQGDRLCALEDVAFPFLPLVEGRNGAGLQPANVTLEQREQLIPEALRQQWGHALAKRSQRTSVLPGGIAARRHGLRSASEEAALAFPVLFETALPALNDALARGLTPRQARLETLFHIIAVLDDSNLAHRGGLGGLRAAQRAAQGFLDRGGIARAGGLPHAEAIAGDFVRQRLSPGGAADTLAAACWIQRVCPAP